MLQVLDTAADGPSLKQTFIPPFFVLEKFIFMDAIVRGREGNGGPPRSVVHRCRSFRKAFLPGIPSY